MIHADEDALICDLAETYHIMDYRALPLKLVATLAAGLGVNSRIKQKIRGEKASMDLMLLMSVIDHLKILIWQRSEDGCKGINFPKSLLSQLLNQDGDRDVLSFETSNDFEKERQRILEGVK